MAEKRAGSPTWATVKGRLKTWEVRELISLIADLYRLSQTNRDMLHSKAGLESSPLDRYMHSIRKALSPNVLRNQHPDPAGARRAISDFRRAVVDHLGLVELLVSFVELGNYHVVSYGDFDTKLLSAILKSFSEATGLIVALPDDSRDSFKERLRTEIMRAHGAGYGYYDEMVEIYEGAFA